MEDMTGVCRYCGQTRIVKAENQEDADNSVTLNCNCEGGEFERKKKEVGSRLDELIGETAPEYGWEPADPDVYEDIRAMAMHVLTGNIGSVGIRLQDTSLKIHRSKGKISIERSKTIRQGGTIEK